jgi:adsorption protein B
MSSLYWPYLLADYYHGLEVAAAVVGVIILLSSLDDLFVDACFWLREIYRKVAVKPRYQALTSAQLRAREEQAMAIMVPAWLEFDVIAPMLENMVSVLEYSRYTIFVGTYRNDPRTIAEVERMRRRYRQLVRVEVPNDGPTCKADCLNWIVQAIFRREQELSITYAGMVLHDSEDVLHPLELKYFNYLLPRIDFIQVPVSSLEREWYELVAGTYMDEFAEWHSKDLVVRESLSKQVPSAGVGTCFSHHALASLAAETQNQPFNTESLTEDYDIAARLSRRGMKQIFGKFPVEYVVRRGSWFGLAADKTLTLRMPLGVREYFPDTFRTAYRQKARWTLGIGLQGWKLTGWGGSLATKYLLFRDRKGLLTSFIAIIAYLLLANFMAFYAADSLGWWNTYYPSFFPRYGWLSTLMWANSVALLMRIAQRSYFVGKMYGWEHALLAIPRMVIGNFINAMAAARAWKLFFGNVLFGTRLVWDKTMHDFPSSDRLANDRQRLGELLVSWQAIDVDRLNVALAEQKLRRGSLGRVLMSMGWLNEATLAEAIAFQADLPRARLNAAQLRVHAGLLPMALCIRHNVLALGPDGDDGMRIAVSSPLAPETLDLLAGLLHARPRQVVVLESELAAGLRLLRGGDDTFGLISAQGSGLPLLGDVLIEMRLVDQFTLNQAMQAYLPAEHGQLGGYLVASGVITPQALARAIDEQRAISERLRAQAASAPTGRAPMEWAT